jgi:hypothetical protein
LWIIRFIILVDCTPKIRCDGLRRAEKPLARAFRKRNADRTRACETGARIAESPEGRRPLIEARRGD